MAESQRAQSCVVDQNPVPRPYPSRTEQIPMERFRPDADWIGRIMANRYPGIVAETMEVVQIFDSHTTKILVAVDWNDAGKAAGKLGRESSRERGCQYVYVSVGDVSL